MGELEFPWMVPSLLYGCPTIQGVGRQGLDDVDKRLSQSQLEDLFQRDGRPIPIGVYQIWKNK